jgi:hypothetical protein
MPLPARRRWPARCHRPPARLEYCPMSMKMTVPKHPAVRTPAPAAAAVRMAAPRVSPGLVAHMPARMTPAAHMPARMTPAAHMPARMTPAVRMAAPGAAVRMVAPTVWPGLVAHMPVLMARLLRAVRTASEAAAGCQIRQAVPIAWAAATAIRALPAGMVGPAELVEPVGAAGKRSPVVPAVPVRSPQVRAWRPAARCPSPERRPPTVRAGSAPGAGCGSAAVARRTAQP